MFFLKRRNMETSSIQPDISLLTLKGIFKHKELKGIFGNLRNFFPQIILYK